MNVIITGDKGLIGSFLKARLEKEGNRILACIDLRDGKDIIGMKDLQLEDLLIIEPVDLLVHCAAHCKINQAVKNPELSDLNDAEGTFQVLEFCRKNNIKKILNFSSSRVLNKEKNPYTAAKIYGEELCKGYSDCYGIDYITIRPSTVYAPYWDITARLMHIFITNALQEKDLEVYGNPKTKTLDFTYIDDFIDGVMFALKREWNKTYNISGEEEYNVFKLAEFIIKQTGSKSKIVVKEPEIAQPQEVRLDISEIKKLGYKPKVGVEEGAKRCIDFYKEYMKGKGMI